MAASLGDTLLIKLGIDADALKTQLTSVINDLKGGAANMAASGREIAQSMENGAQATGTAVGKISGEIDKGVQKASEAGKAFEGMAGKWTGAIRGILGMIAGPVAAAVSVGSVISSYFNSVSEVAQMTGAYSKQWEDWQKKRAMLARINRDDIEMYKKGREALTKFQITMGDMSAKIMRTVSPALLWLIDGLDKLSDWIGRNEGTIVRFVTVAAAVIGTLLIPTFKRLTVAMLASPLTWIIAGITALILIVDDLVTYLQGGESAFGSVWKPLVDGVKAVINWFNNLSDTSKTLLAILASLFAFKGFVAFITGAKATAAAFSLFGKAAQAVKLVTIAVKALGAAFMANPILAIISLIIIAFIALYENWDTVCKWCSEAWNWLCDKFNAGIDFIKGAWDAYCNAWLQSWETIKGWFNAGIEAIKGFFSNLIDFYIDLGTRIIGIFTSMWDGIKTGCQTAIDFVNGIIDGARQTILNWIQSIREFFSFDSLVAKAKSALSSLLDFLPNSVKKMLKLDFKVEDQDGKPKDDGSEPQDTGRRDTGATNNAPLVPSASYMTQAQYNSVTNRNQSNVSNRNTSITINTNNPESARQTIDNAQNGNTTIMNSQQAVY